LVNNVLIINNQYVKRIHFLITGNSRQNTLQFLLWTYNLCICIKSDFYRNLYGSLFCTYQACILLDKSIRTPHYCPL